MQGDAAIIEALNDVLTAELTAINQYFIHHKMCANWGYARLSAKKREESIEEMKHADRLIRRILFLEGLPNLQDYGKLLIAEDVRELLDNDRQLELDALALYREIVAACETVQDYVSRDLMGDLIAAEEEHLDWLDTQIELFQSLGREKFLQHWM